MRIRNIYLFEFHVTAAWTFQRIMVERTFDTENPALHDAYGPAEMAFHQMNETSGLLIRHGIKSVIAKHVKSFFRNMNDQFLNEIVSVFGFGNDFVIFMTLIPVGYTGTVIVCDT